jgi:hypothetical protein
MRTQFKENKDIGTLDKIHKRFIVSHLLLVDMDPNEFFFLVLPLGVLIFMLVSLVVYFARKEETLYHRELEMVNALLLSGTLDKVNFASTLHNLLHDKKIDQHTYKRLGKLLDATYKK